MAEVIKKEGKSQKTIIKEIPAKVKVIRQISKEEENRMPSPRPSGLERREQEIEREFSNSVTAADPNTNFLIRANVSPQSISQARTTGNTASQRRPQEDSDAVKRWYAQSLRTAEQERKYQVAQSGSTVIPQDTTFGRKMIGENQELQNLHGQSID